MYLGTIPNTTKSYLEHFSCYSAKKGLLSQERPALISFCYCIPDTSQKVPDRSVGPYILRVTMPIT